MQNDIALWNEQHVSQFQHILNIFIFSVFSNRIKTRKGTPLRHYPLDFSIDRSISLSFSLLISQSLSFPFFLLSLLIAVVSEEIEGEMSSGRKITLKSSDGETFEVDEAVALESQTIKHMIEDDCADNGIPLPNVTSKILSKVIEYCKKHVEAPKSDDRASSADDDLKAWDADFVKVDQATLFDLILVSPFFAFSSLDFIFLVLFVPIPLTFLASVWF